MTLAHEVDMHSWQRIRKRHGLQALFGICAVALTRMLFRSHLLYDLDSVNFALGMRRFDPASHQPHPPGYFLYVCLGRLVNVLAPDPNTALVAISIAASCAAAWFLFLLTREWFGAEAGALAVALFLFSPLGWFHGVVALTYIVEACFSAAIGYWCWRASVGSPAAAIAASIAFGLAAGFRPSTALLLGPLWLWSVWRAGGAQRWLSILAAGVIMLAWVLPMLEAAGGLSHYLSAFRQLWSTIPGRSTTLSSAWLAVARAFTIVWILVMCFGSATLLLFYVPPVSDARRADRRRILWIWIAPGVLFFTFVFLNYVNSGYLLVLAPPVFAVLANRLHSFLTLSPSPLLRRTAIVVGAIVNCAFFAAAPLYCSYASIRDFERELTAITADFRGGLSPEDTLIVGFDSHFLGYRHAGYYLPEFTVAQYPEVSYADGKRVFVMKGRDTHVTARFPAGQFRQVIFFPLPPGAEYTAYLDRFRAKLPAGTVEEKNVAGRKILSAPASAIPVLFPSTTK